MAKFINQVKLAWLKGMEVLGTSASNLANNAKHKVAEINLETRRREILTEFSLQAFDLWQKGEKLPEPLDAMLKELSELDERLSVLRAQKYATVGSDAEKESVHQTGDISGKDEASDGKAQDVLSSPEPGETIQDGEGGGADTAASIETEIQSETIQEVEAEPFGND